MSAHPFSLVIFDFDGTLADSQAWFRGALNGAARRFGFREASETEIEALRGKENREIIRSLGVPMWKIPLIARHMRRAMSREAHTIRLFPGAEPLVRRLGEAGIAVAIVSSNSEENIRRILGAETARRINHLVCGASIFGKSRKFTAVLKRSGVGPGRAIGIGDEARDIEAARAANIAAGAVAWGYADAKLLASLQPDFAFATFDEIAAALIR